MENSSTRKGARTTELDPNTHRVCVIAAPWFKTGIPYPSQSKPQPFAADGTFSLPLLDR